MRGESGQSAYDLWVGDVISPEGLEDPHNPGELWPKHKTTLHDFWEYLTGVAMYPEIPDEETGKPGAPIAIISGRPNVIVQYVNQANNEFVSWEDGSVAYIVYNDAGEIAPNAVVKGLPGIDSDKEYTADDKGFFIIPKEDLPENEPLDDRRGTTSYVTYRNSQGQTVTGVSAGNTLVPNRMQVRIRLGCYYYNPSGNTPSVVLDGTYMTFPSIIVERRSGGSGEDGWQMIPSYLGNLNQQIIASVLDNPDNVIFDTTTPKLSAHATDASRINLSIVNSLRINRLKKAASYYMPTADLWDGHETFFTLFLNSYYGETPHLVIQNRATPTGPNLVCPLVIEMAPIQAMPMITNIRVTSLDAATHQFFARVEGDIDIIGANIDDDLLFRRNFYRQYRELRLPPDGHRAYIIRYTPIVESRTVVDSLRQFVVRFNVTGSNMNNSNNPASITNRAFSILTPRLGASVLLECSSSYFYSLNTVGYLKAATGPLVPTYQYMIERRNLKEYTFTNIPVTYIP